MFDIFWRVYLLLLVIPAALTKAGWLIFSICGLIYFIANRQVTDAVTLVGVVIVYAVLTALFTIAALALLEGI